VEEGVGYIKVDALKRANRKRSQLIKALQKQGAKKLILDLRIAVKARPRKVSPPPTSS